MGVKPMNCPGHCHLFAHAAATPTATCRSATQSRDCCTATRPRACCTASCACATSPRTTGTSSAPRSRSQDEVSGCLEMAFATYELFDFDVRLELSTRPEQRVGDRRDVGPRRGQADAARSRSSGLDYELNPGDGAFYGPKIDMHMTDSLGRSWQLGTVQLDYSMPARFELSYTGADNQEHTPGDDPPRDVRLLRALHRDHARALRRRAAAVAGARAGDRAARVRPLQRLRAAAVTRQLARRRRCAWSSTTAASRSGARSARRSCARSLTCWSSASASRASGDRARCASTGGGDAGSMSRRQEFARATARASYTRRR